MEVNREEGLVHVSWAKEHLWHTGRRPRRREREERWRILEMDFDPFSPPQPPPPLPAPPPVGRTGRPSMRFAIGRHMAQHQLQVGPPPAG